MCLRHTFFFLWPYWHSIFCTALSVHIIIYTQFCTFLASKFVVRFMRNSSIFCLYITSSILTNLEQASQYFHLYPYQMGVSLNAFNVHVYLIKFTTLFTISASKQQHFRRASSTYFINLQNVLGHVSEGGPPIGWRCDIFPEKMKCQWCFQNEDDYIHYSFWSHFKA